MSFVFLNSFGHGILWALILTCLLAAYIRWLSFFPPLLFITSLHLHFFSDRIYIFVIILLYEKKQQKILKPLVSLPACA